MHPNRKTVINDSTIEEFYWCGRMVVYVNNYKTDKSFNQACKDAEYFCGICGQHYAVHGDDGSCVLD